MAGLEVRIEFNHIPAVSGRAVERAKAVVAKASHDVETAAKTSMQGGKSGRMYGNHQASAPGEAPAIDTGNLRSSIVVDFEDNGLTGVVAVGAEYGLFLEMGTRHMAPRPFMTPAAEKVRPLFLAAMRQIVDEG